MTPRLPWFLSGEPDVLALLDEQVEATVAGMRAYAAWTRSASDDDGQTVRDAEHAADDARRRMVDALRRSAGDAPRARGPLHDVGTARRRHQRSEELGTRRGGARSGHQTPLLRAMADLLLEGTEHVAERGAAASGATRPKRASGPTTPPTAPGSSRRPIAPRSCRCESQAARGRAGARHRRSRRTETSSRSRDAIVHVAHRIWYSVFKAT